MKCFPKYGTMIKPGKTLLVAPFGSVCHKTGVANVFQPVTPLEVALA